jgi:hypothetical protein
MEGFFVLGIVLLSVCMPVGMLVWGANMKEKHKLRFREMELLGGAPPSRPPTRWRASSGWKSACASSSRS